MIHDDNQEIRTDLSRSYLGNYRLIRLLGQGGFASIYLGEHRYLKRLAAIKVLRTSLVDQEKEHFLREAQFLAKLSHPRIVRVLEFAIATKHTPLLERTIIENIPFLVMDYVAGGNLRTMHPAGTCLSLNTVAIYIKQIAEVLQYAHNQQIIHRDIKPENLLFNEQQEIMLTDFGLALFAPRTGFLSQKEMAGTLLYTAPEQLRGKPEFASDQYSLGIMAYEWLCGYPPFRGMDIDVMMDHVSSPPPPLRSKNAFIPPAVEEVVMKALAKNPQQRYPTVLAFAQALEQVCNIQKPYSVANLPVMTNIHPQYTTDQYTTGYNSSQALISTPTIRQVPARLSRFKKSHALLLLLSLAILLSSIPIYNYASSNFAHTTTSLLPDTIGVAKAPDGELIGISDGTFIFDTQSSAAALKEQAAQKLKQGDTGSAFSLFSAAHSQDTSDAEALIYQENLRTLNSKYITLVLGTTLTGDPNSISVGHDNLQGAYIAQKEYNASAEQHNGVKVRLLIANSGSKASYASLVAQQIAHLAQKDKTIVALMGWSVSAPAFAAVTQLSQAQIPMVSTAGGDNLTGISKYFFRVAAPAMAQSSIASQYATHTLKAKNAVIFIDPTNDYSRSLADDFKTNFAVDTNTILATETYTVGDAGKKAERLTTELKDALHYHPDLIYFAGYPADVSILLQHMQPSDPVVMGGNALYELGGYTHVSPSGLSHLRFTALAYPDEWDILHLSLQKPPFFTNYPLAFGSSNPKHIYGYTRADSGAMLAYDATLAILQASNLSLKNTYPLTGHDVQQSLARLNGSQALQGITGQLAFDAEGNPINKAVTLVCNKNGLFKLDVVTGQFLLNAPPFTSYPATSVCA